MLHPGEGRLEADIIPGRSDTRLGLDFRSKPKEVRLSLTFGPCQIERAVCFDAIRDTPEGGEKVDIVLGKGLIAPGSYPSGVTIIINGRDHTKELGGPFDHDVEGLDITPYVQAGFNELIFDSATPGHITIRHFWVTE